MHPLLWVVSVIALLALIFYSFALGASLFSRNSLASRALREWHEKFGVPIADKPTLPDYKRINLRVALIYEEYQEFASACFRGDLVGMADGLADLVYVTYGAAIECGIPLDACFAEVHRSNMTKIFPDGTVKKRADGKILKPETYSPAEIKRILREHGAEI